MVNWKEKIRNILLYVCLISVVLLIAYCLFEFYKPLGFIFALIMIIIYLFTTAPEKSG